ncbi:MAG: conserved repeat domain protein [Solimicrobium sp.]|nr:conserved repeat domain protein [Solimicrobium sp.]
MQEGGNLTVANCLFTRVNPQTVSIGGNGIFSINNSTLTVEKSYFLNGWASRGGAIAADNAASVTINGSTFSNNGTGDGGGAIWISGNQTSTSVPAANATYGPARLTNVAITNNVFTNGYAGGSGGAISIENAGQVAIAGSKFVNNSSSYDGGALSVINASGLEIKGSTFGSFENGIANPSKGNRADDFYGGAIYAASISGSLVITSTNFYGNSSFAGGAIFTYAQDQNAAILISESTFTGNRADYGGAILDNEEITGGAKTVTLAITKNTFSNNIASVQGPAIYYDGSEMSVNGRDLTTRQFGSVDEKVIRKWLIQDNNYTLKDSDIFAPL